MAIELPKPIAVTPVPNVRYREFTKCGQKPLSGGQIWTYDANSTTPKATYQDPYGFSPNTNPIILDAAGEADIYLNGTYRFVVKDRHGVIQKDVARIGSWFSGDLEDQMKSVNDALENSAQQLMQPLQDAIDIALAGGAGEAGWTDQLVQTWSERNQQAKNKDSVHVLDFKIREGRQIPDQQAMQDAVDYCVARGVCLNWDGTYLSRKLNVRNFWKVKHFGRGGIKTDSQTFHITPADSEVNTLFVSTVGANENDGLDAVTAIPLSRVVDRLTIVAKNSLIGQWRIKLAAGEYTSNGIRYNDVPSFRKPLQIHGEDTNHYSNIKTIWRESGGSNVYAIRAENSTPTVRVEFKYIRYEGWKSGSNSGAILCWNPCSVIVDTCAFVECAMGVSIRYGQMRAKRSLFQDNGTWGAAGAYQSTVFIGDLVGGGNTFIRSSIDVSRTSIGYIQGNTFIECHKPITCSRVSRVRTQANKYVSWTGAIITTSLNSVYTPDNGGGHPDTYVQTPSFENPVYRSTNGSVHLNMQYGAQFTHLSSAKEVKHMGVIDTPFLLSQSESSWVPFRLPSYTMYGDARLNLELTLAVPKDASGSLALHGDGPGQASLIGAIKIPINSDKERLYNVRFEVVRNNPTSMRAFVSCPELQYSGFKTTSLTSGSAKYFIEPVDAIKLFRLYYTPSSLSTIDVTFHKMRSWVEC